LEIDSDEVSVFVKSVISGVLNGIPEGLGISKAVKVQMGITSKKAKGGKLKLSVVGIGASKSNEEVIRVDFEVDDVITVSKEKLEAWLSSDIGKGVLKSYLQEHPEIEILQ